MSNPYDPSFKLYDVLYKADYIVVNGDELFVDLTMPKDGIVRLSDLHGEWIYLFNGNPLVSIEDGTVEVMAYPAEFGLNDEENAELLTIEVGMWRGMTPDDMK